MRKLVVPILALLLSGCAQPASPTATPSRTASPTLAPTASASPSPPASPSPTLAPTPTPSPTPTPTAAPTATPSPTGTPAAASPSADCIHGWTSPAEGDAKRALGLTILANYMGLADQLVVDDLRYFRGPDPENILDPRYENLERWYIKAYLASDPTYAGRWLVEKRTKTVLGVSAVAPYDTTGWQSPDWSGFEGDGAPRAIKGLPGKWGGIQYDFVTGNGDSGFPGLPDSQVGCLAGT
jgi:hypothetical protein